MANWLIGCATVVWPAGPHARYTHWKQTVFYLDQDLTVNAGEKIRGTIHVKPNDVNHRDQDIQIQYQFSGQGHASTPVDVTQEFRMR
jgi:hypothetical protein